MRNCIYFTFLILITFIACTQNSFKIVDFIPDKEKKGFVEFYPSDNFLKYPHFSIFDIEIYQYGPKGSKPSFSETCGKGLRIAKIPGSHTFFVSPKLSTKFKVERIKVKIFDNKITPVRIDILFTKDDSSISVETFDNFIDDVALNMEGFYIMDITVEKPVPIRH